MGKDMRVVSSKPQPDRQLSPITPLNDNYSDVLTPSRLLTSNSGLNSRQQRLLTMQQTLGNQAVMRFLAQRQTPQTAIGRIHRETCDDCDESREADEEIELDLPSVIISREVGDGGTDGPDPAPVPVQAAYTVDEIIGHLQRLNRPDPVAGAVSGTVRPIWDYLDTLSVADYLNILGQLRTRGSLFDLAGRQSEGSPSTQTRRDAIFLTERLAQQPAGTQALSDLRLGRELLESLNSTDRTALTGVVPALQPPAITINSSDVTPPAGSPHGSIPEPLRQTLFRSYQARQLGSAFSATNLDNSFWGGAPGGFWQAVDRLAAGGSLAIIQNIYSRFTNAGLPWGTIEAIHNIWGGSSLGFEFVSSNPQQLRQAVMDNNQFCRDWWIADPFSTIHPGKTCYREVVTGSPGLHVCFAGGGRIHDVHIDPHQAVKQRDDDGTCSYAIGATVRHWHDLATN